MSEVADKKRKDNDGTRNPSMRLSDGSIAKKPRSFDAHRSRGDLRGMTDRSHASQDWGEVLGPDWFPDPIWFEEQIMTTKTWTTILLFGCGTIMESRSLQPLGNLYHLQSLTLKGIGTMTTATFTTLGSLPSLKFLNLSGALSLPEAPMDGFYSLAGLNLSDCPNLRHITFHAGSPLEKLLLQGCARLSDGGLSTIHNLSRLEHINLSGTGVTDSVVALLSSKQIQGLHLCCCQGISNAGLTYISEMYALNSLDLTGLPISDFGLAKLADLPELRRLCLAQCPKVSKAGLAWLLQNSQSLALRTCAASLAVRA